MTIAETGTIYQAAFTAATRIACGTMQMMYAFDYGRKVFIGSGRDASRGHKFGSLCPEVVIEGCLRGFHSSTERQQKDRGMPKMVEIVTTE
ncbi:hypothetical protein PGT21_022239 [Puccinia graminis f. sp. tritici]|uniref:Uncharacterized protein n=1 Tax=Puccinia graminis f. sp. tritici TaxID=56615 RepID=A0A5B0PG85_PUCGR|nr:hypothetical protein PGT21_022239 [Puccinia graminis f. sp. tritici]